MVDPTYSSVDAGSPASPRYNSFLPLVVLALSLIVILSWELIVASQLRRNGKELREQQTKMVEQSRNIQTGLEKLARDLIDVSKTDDDAKAIVAKYAIAVNNPSPTPSPSANR